MGICYVHGGNSLAQTIKSNANTRDMLDALDHASGDARKVPGSGNRFKTELWLDASDRTSSFMFPRTDRGHPVPMTLAVNQLANFFSVRSNNIELKAGEEVTLRIKQIQYVATTDFREQTLETRQCRFPSENPGNNSLSKHTSMILRTKNLPNFR